MQGRFLILQAKNRLILCAGNIFETTKKIYMYTRMLANNPHSTILSTAIEKYTK